MAPIGEGTRMHPDHPVRPVQNSESFFSPAAVGQHWLAVSLRHHVPMSSVEFMQCSAPGHRVPIAVAASHGPGR